MANFYLLRGYVIRKLTFLLAVAVIVIIVVIIIVIAVAIVITIICQFETQVESVKMLRKRILTFWN